MNILYVEDNKINAMVMDKMLSKNNSNVGLNQMDGCELLQRFKKLKFLQDIPVFAVTAYAMPGDKQRFLHLGFDNYFSKPVDFDKLLSVISRIRNNLELNQ